MSLRTGMKMMNKFYFSSPNSEMKKFPPNFQRKNFSKFFSPEFSAKKFFKIFFPRIFWADFHLFSKIHVSPHVKKQMVQTGQNRAKIHMKTLGKSQITSVLIRGFWQKNEKSAEFFHFWKRFDGFFPQNFQRKKFSKNFGGKIFPQNFQRKKFQRKKFSKNFSGKNFQKISAGKIFKKF